MHGYGKLGSRTHSTNQISHLGVLEFGGGHRGVRAGMENL